MSGKGSTSSSKSFVYHEQQESALCGQHCLNNLLQGPHFTAVDLAEIANQLDEMERNLQKDDLRAYYSFQSNNVDDSGNFSIQVLKSALQNYCQSDLISWHQDPSQAIQAEMTEAAHENNKAFVVNRSNHWFTIRKIGNHWWNLNSTNDFPQLISPFYLSAFLTQLRAEGYSVFLVTGPVPDRGDPELSKSYLPNAQSIGRWYDETELLSLNGAGGQSRGGGGTIAAPPSFAAFQGKGNRLGGDLQHTADIPNSTESYDEELELAKAISASLQPEVLNSTSASNPTPVTSSAPMNPKDEIRMKRLAALGALDKK